MPSTIFRHWDKKISKIRDTTLIKFFDTRHFQKHQKLPLQNFLVLWDKRTFGYCVWYAHTHKIFRWHKSSRDTKRASNEFFLWYSPLLFTEIFAPGQMGSAKKFQKLQKLPEKPKEPYREFFQCCDAVRQKKFPTSLLVQIFRVRQRRLWAVLSLFYFEKKIHFLQVQVELISVTNWTKAWVACKLVNNKPGAAQVAVARNAGNINGGPLFSEK